MFAQNVGILSSASSSDSSTASSSYSGKKSRKSKRSRRSSSSKKSHKKRRRSRENHSHSSRRSRLIPDHIRVTSPAMSAPPAPPAAATPAVSGTTPVSANDGPLTAEEARKIREERDKYKKERDAVVAASTTPTGKIGDKNDEMVRLIRQCLKFHVFKTVKFVTTPEGEHILMEAILNNLKMKGFTGTEPEVKINRENFKRDYLKVCTSQLNDLRNNTQAGIKNAVRAWIEAGKKPRKLPPIEDFVAIINRKLDLNDPAKLATALWWVDGLMPTFTCNGLLFDVEVRYFSTISEAKTNPEHPDVDITSETEAFGYLCLENNYTKWPKLFELERKNPAKGLKSVVMAEKKDGFVEKKNHRHFYRKDYPELSTKYTNPDSGQQKFGGWIKDGVNRYIKIKEIIRNKRVTEESKAWEALLLQKLRESKNITAPTWEEQQKLNGKRKADEAQNASGISAEDLFEKTLESDADEDLDVVPL